MLKESELNKIQNKINYKFSNTKLLQQAFTRKSYSASHGDGDNEVLEFYGDRILDFAVIKDFYNQFGKLNNKRELVSSKNVGDLCQKDIELVKNANLAEQITRLGLTKYIQVHNQNEKTVLKNKADLFEAILGAIAIDSNWNVKAIESAYKTMITSNRPKEEEEPVYVNYIDLFDDLIWKFQICKTGNKYTKLENGVECHALMLIDGKSCEIKGFGKDEHAAKVEASEHGYKLLKLLFEKEFTEDESYSDQLYYLFKYGFIGEPDFRFEYYPANSNYPDDLWRCFGTLSDSDLEYQIEGSNMTEVKEQVCYAILCEVLGINNDFETEEEPVEEVQEEEIVQGQGLLKLIMSKYSRFGTVAA